jgi:hypothetical protein
MKSRIAWQNAAGNFLIQMKETEASLELERKIDSTDFQKALLWLASVGCSHRPAGCAASCSQTGLFRLLINLSAKDLLQLRIITGAAQNDKYCVPLSAHATVESCVGQQAHSPLP